MPKIGTVPIFGILTDCPNYATEVVVKYLSLCDWYSSQVLVVMSLEEFVIMWMLKTSMGGRTRSQALSFFMTKSRLVLPLFSLREGCFALSMLPSLWSILPENSTSELAIRYYVTVLSS